MIKFLTLTFLFCIAAITTFAQLPQDILQKYNLELKSTFTQYDYNRFNVPTMVQKNDLKENNIKVNQSTWSVISKITKSTKDKSYDLKISYKCLEGTLDQAAVGFELNFSKWNKENYVLLPASAYNGNKFEYRRINYSPKLLDPKDIGPDKPTIVTDIPKLSLENAPSRIQERSGGMSTPAIGFQSMSSKNGFFMMTTQENNYGDYGMGIEENRDKSNVLITMQSPIVREVYKYRIADNRFPSDDKPANFKAGDTLSIVCKLYFFESPSIQSLYDYFFDIRKDMSNFKNFKNEIPLSEAMHVLEKKFNDQNWVDEFGYYAIGMRENFLQDWQIGWTGGMISTLPLYTQGSKLTQDRVIKNFNWLFPNGISPSGFFWDSGEKGTIWHGGDIRKPHTKNWHLVRKSGDGLYFVLKQLMVFQKNGLNPTQNWDNGTRKVSNSFVNLWTKWKQLGNFVDSQTGDVIVGGSTSGGIVPAALVLASEYFKDPIYLEKAKEIGQYYFDNFVSKGLTTGGPGDAMQNPDSESCYALVESYMCLYSATNDPKWLKMAEDIAKQFATWVSTYNYRFPTTSMFGKLGIESYGAVFANTQNKHGAPNICTHSGSALLQLYRATGNEKYLDLLQGFTHNQTQFMSHPKKPIADLPNGWMSERVSTTDWLEGIGEIVRHTTWSETALMLSYAEIPGIYVDLSKRKCIINDHAIVKILKSNPKSMTIQLSNPTDFDATYKVLVDNKESLKNKNYPNFNFQTLTLKAKESKKVELKVKK